MIRSEKGKAGGMTDHDVTEGGMAALQGATGPATEAAIDG